MTTRSLVMRTCLLVACSVLLGAVPALAESGVTREYQVKAAFIYNFIQFVDWPDDAFEDENSPLVVALIGSDPFEGALDKAIEGKVLHNRRLTLRRYQTIEQVQRCHVLFVGDYEAPSLSELLQRLDAMSVLTIGEVEQFTSAGGIIRFFMEENKIRFEVNVDAAARARLKMSSRLLKLARIFQK